MPRRCLIVEAIPLIAHDLALTAQEHGLTPIVVGNEAEALTWLDGNADAGLGLAFVHQGSATFAASRLHGALSQLQARVVLMGGDAAATHEGTAWTILDWPFTTSRVTALLESLGARRSGTCGP